MRPRRASRAREPARRQILRASAQNPSLAKQEPIQVAQRRVGSVRDAVGNCRMGEPTAPSAPVAAHSDSMKSAAHMPRRRRAMTWPVALHQVDLTQPRREEIFIRPDGANEGSYRRPTSLPYKRFAQVSMASRSSLSPTATAKSCESESPNTVL